MIIGIDEVGRGCLAGDVYAAGVMIPEDMPALQGITDSKALTASTRERLCGVLVNHPDIHFALSYRSVTAITGDLQACFNDIIQTFKAFCPDIKEVRIDGNYGWHFRDAPPVRYIVKGDAKEWSIGAASIIAKVTRDRYMREQGLIYPGYGWERNAGYGTQEHIEAIKRLGLTPLHRVKFCDTALRNAGVKKDTVDVFEIFGV